MPYLTPEATSTEDTCRRLLIPDNPEWLAIVSGALTELLFVWNWQEKGITVDEALTACQAIVDSYYDQPCVDPNACVTEEDTRIIRLVPGGEWQELIDGTWQTPEGDYEIEPTPARSESSEIDRLCLASKNSVNALKLLYEEVTDAFDEFGAIEPVVAALLAGIGVVVAAFVSVAAAAFVALGAWAIEQFFQLLGTISYDLWTTEFEEMLYCIFLENATNDDDVTHFDYDAIVAGINDEINGLNLDFQRKQLAIQVLYLLSIIGRPGIEWAGTTTAITDDDCGECDCFVYDDDMDTAQGAKDHAVPYAGIPNAWGGSSVAGGWLSVGGRTGGGVWNSSNIGSFAGQVRRQSCLVIDLGAEYTVNACSFYHKESSNGQANSRGINYYNGSGTLVYTSSTSSGNTSTSWRQFTNTVSNANIRYIRVYDDAINSTTAETYLDDILVEYC